jgi:phosphatidylglycerophosphatase A
VKRQFALGLATAGGVGYAPFAPGTFGSVVGIAVWAILRSSPPAVHAAVIGILFALGWWSGNVAEQYFGRSDPSQVVLDEVVGVLITLFLIPVGWPGALLGFLLFRLSDIVKPFPANRLEQLHGGLGIMADDAMAAIYANLALRASLLSFHYFAGY